MNAQVDGAALFLYPTLPMLDAMQHAVNSDKKKLRPGVVGIGYALPNTVFVYVDETHPLKARTIINDDGVIIAHVVGMPEKRIDFLKQ